MDINVTPAGTPGQGATNLNFITINSSADNKEHTESHELGHFLLLGSPLQPDTHMKHDARGGIFQYKQVDADGGVIKNTAGMTKSNIGDFIRNIPYKQMRSRNDIVPAQKPNISPVNVASLPSPQLTKIEH